MLAVGLVLLTVPLLVLLTHYRVIPGDFVASLAQWEIVSTPQSLLSTAGQATIVVVGGLVALIGVGLVLAELLSIAGGGPTPSVRIQDEPGRETLLKPEAVRNLVEATSRRAGARDATVRLSPERQAYDVALSVRAPHETDLRRLTTEIRDELNTELQRQHVPVRRLEVTVTDVI